MWTSSALLLLVAVLGTASSQLIIPKRPLGFVYNMGSSSAQINLDIHMGPLCPDSRDAFPTAKAVASHYGASTLKLTLHLFPLPYHHHAYLTAIGAHSVRKLTSVDMAYKWFEKIYNEKLPFLSNDATINATTNEVISLLGTYAAELSINKDSFLTAMKLQELETNTRTAWKYSCTRGVSGTPTFFLNDVPVAADPAWTLDDWKQVIDPLLNGLTTNNETCRIGTKKCEFLPGKVECCTKGENCIPNVGCRCFGDNCIQESKVKSCPVDTKRCEYLPGKEECCTKGEACIPNVGCRCFSAMCRIQRQVRMMEIKPID